MTDNKNKSGNDNWGTRQERRMAERFTIAAVMAVVIVLYNLLDPKHILLEYLSLLLYKFSVLWNQFVVSAQRNWLVYLTGLIGAWIIAASLPKLFEPMKVPENTHQDDLEPGFGEKWGKRISGYLVSIFTGIRSFLAVVIVIYVMFISILLNPIGKLINNFDVNLSRDLLLILNCICGLAGLVGVWFFTSIIKDYFSEESQANRYRPKFYEEMQETLGSILGPMGFEEKDGPAGLTRWITFSRDQFVVDFWYDVRDQIYFVEASSRYSLKEREKGTEAIIVKSNAGGELDQVEYAKLNAKDFSVDGTILEADTFKSNAISKLHRWLAEHNVGQGAEYLTTNNDGSDY